MGLLDTVKGWFNIGGVKVDLPGFVPVVSRSGNVIKGRAGLTTESDKTVNQMVYRFTRQTTVKGQEGNSKFDHFGQLDVGPAFEIKKGETKTFDFEIPYSLEGVAQDPTGRLGTAEYHAMLSDPKASPRVIYYISAVAQVQGAIYNRGKTVEVAIVD
jgi:hypothetical protein